MQVPTPNPLSIALVAMHGKDTMDDWAALVVSLAVLGLFIGIIGYSLATAGKISRAPMVFWVQMGVLVAIAILMLLWVLSGIRVIWFDGDWPQRQ